MTPDQARRVALGGEVLDQYCWDAEGYSLESAEVVEDGGNTVLADLLADLLHYAAFTDDYNFDAALDRARRHFAEETED